MARRLASEAVRVPCMVYRSGTSRGALFLGSDLSRVPKPEAGRHAGEGTDWRDTVAARLMGSGHQYEVDGLGGGRTSTSKAVWVQKSSRDGFHVDCKFVQAEIYHFGVDESHGDCGNMLASVGAFAIERGLAPPAHPTATVSVCSLNTGTEYEIEVCTRGDGSVEYAGDHSISGVAGTGSPVKVSSLNCAGRTTGSLLPTTRSKDTIAVDGREIEATCVDFSRPMVLVRAADVGMTGRETKAECDANAGLMRRMEEVRVRGGELMGMGDCRNQASPKVCVLSGPEREGQNISARYFAAPYENDLHYALAMTGAQCIAAACLVEGSVASQVCTAVERTEGGEHLVSIGHPSGTAEVLVSSRGGEVTRASYVRTVRPVIQGDAFYTEVSS